MIHGGAGAILNPEKYADSLRRIVESGAARLAAGASALDAVAHCVTLLEDDPLYNAGRGSVLNADGAAFCDASIMDGRTLAAGAVAGVQRVRNPVLLARLTMEKSRHVFLIGEGAERFGRAHGAVFEDDSYFVTPERLAQLARAKKMRQEMALDHSTTAHDKLGTVGAVARDADGNLAAATSTGGLVNQIAGRVGDSPVIGAGVFADNESCAISCTGVGEHFLRTSLARTAAFLVEQGMTAEDAAKEAVAYLVRKVNGSGGLILVDRRGRCGAARSTPGLLMATAVDADVRIGM